MKALSLICVFLVFFGNYGFMGAPNASVGLPLDGSLELFREVSSIQALKSWSSVLADPVGPR